jgi:hypothetical protein
MLQNPESLSILELFSISWCFFWHAELYLIFSLIQSAKLLMPTVARADPTPAAPRKAFPRSNSFNMTLRSHMKHHETT